MGMSTHVVGVISDEIHSAMLEIKNACEKIGVCLPDEVDKYFENGVSENGKVVDIQNTSWEDRYSSGLEINIKDLPPNIVKIRFYNSW